MPSEIKFLPLDNLLYVIKKENHDFEYLKTLLSNHPEIKFVSLVGMDLKGNGTDERIPIQSMLDDMESFFSLGIQTDGSSVVLHNIATLNDAKVIILPDLKVNWHVDYNFGHLDHITGLPIGTLRIPAFLIHNNKMVCSRSILKKAVKRFKNNCLEIIENSESLKDELGIKDKKIKTIHMTSATELEFWVQTPEDKADEEKLSTSQTLKEQYWKRTEGTVRTAMEKTILMMEKYGFEPEMGHKEVGGVRPQINVSGKQSHIMEQLEIDWKYTNTLQCADNEHFIRHLVLDVFNSHGLEVTFAAKPIEGVAGSGEHTHLGIMAELEDGTKVNLFAHKNFKEEYMSSIGFSSLMGILKNYEVINPFVTSTNDALNRLKPGFEAPVCIVSSLGHSPEFPSRNRSILIGLIKDIETPLSTRFELRAPNPNSNTYLVLASCYQCMLDGISKLAGKYSLKQLEAEFSKKVGDESIYLEKNREYRSEFDVFEHYTESERSELFGKPPATVYENVIAFDSYPEKVETLIEGEVFTKAIIDSYKTSTIDMWINELKGRIIEDNMNLVRNCAKVHDDEISDLDIVNWNRINTLRWELMKDSVDKKSIFTNIRSQILLNDLNEVSNLQKIMSDKVKLLKELYLAYKKNIF